MVTAVRLRHIDTSLGRSAQSLTSSFLVPFFSPSCPDFLSLTSLIWQILFLFSLYLTFILSFLRAFSLCFLEASSSPHPQPHYFSLLVTFHWVIFEEGEFTLTCWNEYVNKGSWQNASHVIYMVDPVQTGWIKSILKSKRQLLNSFSSFRSIYFLSETKCWELSLGRWKVNIFTWW